MPEEDAPASGEAWQNLRASVKQQKIERQNVKASGVKSLEQNILRLQKIWRMVNLGIGVLGIATFGTGLIILALSLNTQWIFGNWLKFRLVAPLSLAEKFITILVDIVAVGMIMIQFVIIAVVVHCSGVIAAAKCGVEALIP